MTLHPTPGAGTAFPPPRWRGGEARTGERRPVLHSRVRTNMEGSNCTTIATSPVSLGDAQTEEDIDALADYVEITIKALKRSLKARQERERQQA